MESNKLVVLSNNQKDLSFITATVLSVFGHEIECIERTPDNSAVDFVPKIVLATESSYGPAPQLYPDSKIVFVGRITSNRNIEKLIMLPEGTPVLVANEPRAAAVETVENLKSAGITHLNFIPYWLSKTPYEENVDIVVYAGFRKFCPPGHKTYIDIGYRDILFSVLAQIVHAYNLSPSILDNLQLSYNLRYVDASYKINSALKDAEASTNMFKKILSMSENIFIATGAEDQIMQFNDSAQRFFNMPSDRVLGKSFHHVFAKDKNMLSLFASTNNISNHVTVINGIRAVTNLTIIDDDPNISKLISIVPATSITEADKKIRSKMRESGFSAKYSFEDILGNSAAMRQTIALAKQYALSDASVLIAGESGTGKEMFAQAIHNLSNRKNFAFVGVNCAALPESLAESELFGYEEGSFTGASKGGKIGKFELAHKGTIFLDEIGDAPLSLQTKLLRVIEEHEIVKIGANKVTPVDVRIICASNRDLRDMVKSGDFRQDLYYRINVLPLNITPLRYRSEDISTVATHMFDHFGLNDINLRKFLLRRFNAHSWPGNVRELRSVIQLCNTLSTISDSKDSEEIDIAYWDNILASQLQSDPVNYEMDEPELDLFTLVLMKVYRETMSGIAFGRGKLLKDTRLTNSGLTEYRLKKILKEMSETGLITIGSTKQGMRITDKGIDILIQKEIING